MNTAGAQAINMMVAEAISRLEKASSRAIQRTEEAIGRVEEASLRAIQRTKDATSRVEKASSQAIRRIEEVSSRSPSNDGHCKWGITTVNKMSDYLLPWDITTEIISRLPVKSLLRFKCVSRSFCDFISNDPFFKKKHLSHHQSSLKKVILVPQISSRLGETVFSCLLSSLSPTGDVCTEDMTELKIPVTLGVPEHPVKNMCNSCDGLFCIGVWGKYVIIWNPSTREVKKFPGGNFLVEKGNGYPYWITYFLAHDPSSHVYKLLGVFRYVLGVCTLRFYSTEMEMWRYVDDRPPCRFVKYASGCAILSGAFHWLGDCDKYFENPRVVVSLDISNETYGTLALPQALYDTTKNTSLCLFRPT